MKLSLSESLLPDGCVHAKEPDSGKEPSHSRAGEDLEKSRSTSI